jgi:hypothetical protein
MIVSQTTVAPAVTIDPLLGVAVRIEKRHDEALHVGRPRAEVRTIRELERDAVGIRGRHGRHPRLVAGAAVVRREHAVAVDRHHRDHVLGGALGLAPLPQLAQQGSAVAHQAERDAHFPPRLVAALPLTDERRQPAGYIRRRKRTRGRRQRVGGGQQEHALRAARPWSASIHSIFGTSVQCVTEW